MKLFSKQEAAAWNAAVLLHRDVQKLHDLLRAAGLDTTKTQDLIRDAANASFDLMRYIEKATA